MHSSYPRGMCLFTNARTVAIVFPRSAGSEAMYCAGVFTFAAGFMDSSPVPTEVYHRTFEIQPGAGCPTFRPLVRGSWGLFGCPTRRSCVWVLISQQCRLPRPE